ncbi:unnamed protein product, partial [Ectocarpus sp. 12 AP-2014]
FFQLPVYLQVVFVSYLLPKGCLLPTFKHLLDFTGGGELRIAVHAVVGRPLTSHPYKVGIEHAGFSPDQTSASPSAKRRKVFGESRRGGATRDFWLRCVYLRWFVPAASAWCC